MRLSYLIGCIVPRNTYKHYNIFIMSMSWHNCSTKVGLLLNTYFEHKLLIGHKVGSLKDYLYVEAFQITVLLCRWKDFKVYFSKSTNLLVVTWGLSTSFHFAYFDSLNLLLNILQSRKRSDRFSSYRQQKNIFLVSFFLLWKIPY